MDNKKQTSVEWFFSELETMQYFGCDDMLEAFQQAKAMHKEEIINATIYGDNFHGYYGLDSKDYYNKTFKQK